MDIRKETKLELLNFRNPATRTFHITWLSFFICFFGWFGVAPLMAVIRDEFALTKAQVGNTIIASVMVTIFARLAIGWLCDRVGPRRAYTWLLLLGSIPVMSIGFANSYETFLLFRLAIGVIGASFVITQFHTSMLYAPNVVGAANATSAGWGNLGGGVTQMVMPLIMGGFVALGFSQFLAWRMAMIVPGLAMIAAGLLYHFSAEDTLDGSYKGLQKAGRMTSSKGASGAFMEAVRDKRVWALFVIYGACFGIELTVNNIAALYFKDYFNMSLKSAGLVAGLFGLMNIFARTLGGYFGDRWGIKRGLRGRVAFLGIVLLIEGIALMLFSRVTAIGLAIPMLMLFSLFVQMSEGATFSTVPFINKRALGAVAGIVGAGGNMGAVMAGFLFRSEAIQWPDALLILGGVVCLSAGLTFVIRFSPKAESAAKKDLEARLVPEGKGREELTSAA